MPNRRDEGDTPGARFPPPLSDEEQKRILAENAYLIELIRRALTRLELRKKGDLGNAGVRHDAFVAAWSAGRLPAASDPRSEIAAVFKDRYGLMND